MDQQQSIFIDLLADYDRAMRGDDRDAIDRAVLALVTHILDRIIFQRRRAEAAEADATQLRQAYRQACGAPLALLPLRELAETDFPMLWNKKTPYPKGA
jgi:hypothetical protein